MNHEEIRQAQSDALRVRLGEVCHEIHGLMDLPQDIRAGQQDTESRLHKERDLIVHELGQRDGNGGRWPKPGKMTKPGSRDVEDVVLDSTEAEKWKAWWEKVSKLRKKSGTKTLRDEFAMAALTGMHANSVWDEDKHEKVAEHAYMAADAMMKARVE